MAPCLDCGHMPRELEELRRGEHRYGVWEVFPGERMILCDFCDADFGSYGGEYWGLPPDRDLVLHEEQYVGKLEAPAAEVDWLCARCRHRLAFIRLRMRVLAANGIIHSPPAGLIEPAQPIVQTDDRKPVSAAPACPGPANTPSPPQLPHPARSWWRRLRTDPTGRFALFFPLAPLAALAGASLPPPVGGRQTVLLGWLATLLVWALTAWASVRHQWLSLPRGTGGRRSLRDVAPLRLRLLNAIALAGLAAAVGAAILLAKLLT